jgi:hypothetical protein
METPYHGIMTSFSTDLKRTDIKEDWNEGSFGALYSCSRSVQGSYPTPIFIALLWTLGVLFGLEDGGGTFLRNVGNLFQTTQCHVPKSSMWLRKPSSMVRSNPQELCRQVACPRPSHEEPRFVCRQPAYIQWRYKSVGNLLTFSKKFTPQNSVWISSFSHVVYLSSPVVLDLFCSRAPKWNFSSTLYPPKLLVYNSSYTQSIIYI